MSQNNPYDYAKAIQYQLTEIVSPVPVYANFNRNFATEPKFVTWQLRNVHQPVYTGVNQNNKGIDRPTFQINTFASGNTGMKDAFDIANSIIQALHGYNGQFGGTEGFYISKADVFWLYNTYDNTVGLQQVIMDCTLDIPT
jgi:hypothetical protein